jgi:spore coat protein U-like protein
MPYEFRILAADDDAELARLIADARTAITVGGSWERFVEVRMAAGPTVRVTCGGGTSFEVSVSWGSQHAQLRARMLDAAIECADRLAYLFYEMRGAGLVRD